MEDNSDDSSEEIVEEMNILFVHEVDYIRKVVFEFQILPELLFLRGHKVYVIDYASIWERNGRLVSPEERMIVSRVYPKALVTLIRPSFVKLPIVSRLSVAISCSRLLRDVLSSYDIDIVILYSVPTNGLQTVKEAKRAGIPIIFRSIDVLHKLVPKPLALPTRILEGLVYRNVDRVLTITPALSRYVEKLGANPAKVKILPLGIDVKPLPDTPELKSRGLWGKTGIICPTLVFAGTLPLFSGLDTLIKQMPELVARIPRLRLLIVGAGKQRPRLEQMIQELGLGEQVKITGMVSHEDVPKWIDTADVGVLTFPVSGATRDIFPTKVLQYMVAGKPVVANPLPGLVDYGLGEGQGVVYTQDGDWATAITYALANNASLGSLARRYVEQEHGYDKIVRGLERELEVLCESRSSIPD